MTNTSNLPVEALELEYPLTLLRYELANDSAGAGTWRGGMGLRRVYRIEADCRCAIDGARFSIYPWGLQGGLEATGSDFNFGNGQHNLPGIVQLRAGQIIEIVTPGGGGYGSPSGRSLDAISRDIKEERITTDYAERVYGYRASPDAGRSAIA
ncbi:5-oxoprolinase (ATP-hydrolyzing) [Agrobacterium tumefaciens]|nr:5-oxoprolinase (ATP-hydrolyzing) [Agrobacterium tumefaciens]